MKPRDPVARLLEAPQYAGAPVDGASAAVAGSVKRGCAVQFSARIRDGRIAKPRYLAFGAPALIAACEHVARACDGEAATSTDHAASAQGVLAALDLPRETLADLLVVEDAWHGLLDALVTKRQGNGKEYEA